MAGGGGGAGTGVAFEQHCVKQNDDNGSKALPHFARMDPSIVAELEAWERTVSPSETGDPLWKLHAYRLARYQLDCCLRDLREAQAPLPRDGADQLRRAVASIGANLSEGYSRHTPADRARFYSYALGSLREAAVWYLSLQNMLAPERLAHRLGLIAQERRLLLGVVNAVNRTTGRRLGN